MRDLLFPVLRQTVHWLRWSGIQRTWPARSLYPYVFQRLKPSVAVVKGHEMFLDPRDSLKLSIFGAYEPLETSLVEREIRPGDVVLDIGANIGYYTLISARAAGDRGRVFAFEPEPDNFSLLTRNIAKNGYRNVEARNQAVADRSGTTRLFLSDDNHGDHRIYDSNDGRRSVEVALVTIDDQFAEEPFEIAFVKMDVQGAEVGALRGMKRTLARSPRVRLLTEFWPWGLARFGFGGTAEEYLRILEELGFAFEEVDSSRGTITPTDRKKLLETYTVENEKFTNLFCRKKRDR